LRVYWVRVGAWRNACAHSARRNDAILVSRLSTASQRSTRSAAARSTQRGDGVLVGCWRTYGNAKRAAEMLRRRYSTA